MDSMMGPKSYWSLLKTCLINKKIPCIPPLFHNNKLISHFRDKAEILTIFLLNNALLLRMQKKFLRDSTSKQLKRFHQSQLPEHIFPK